MLSLEKLTQITKPSSYKWKGANFIPRILNVFENLQQPFLLGKHEIQGIRLQICYNFAHLQAWFKLEIYALQLPRPYKNLYGVITGHVPQFPAICRDIYSKSQGNSGALFSQFLPKTNTLKTKIRYSRPKGRKLIRRSCLMKA